MWLLNVYGMGFTETRLAVIDWLDGEHINSEGKRILGKGDGHEEISGRLSKGLSASNQF